MSNKQNDEFYEAQAELEPVNKRKISDILAEFMDDIEEWQSNVAGSPSKEELAELDNIYSDTIDKLDKEYLK